MREGATAGHLRRGHARGQHTRGPRRNQRRVHLRALARLPRPPINRDAQVVDDAPRRLLALDRARAQHVIHPDQRPRRHVAARAARPLEVLERRGPDLGIIHRANRLHERKTLLRRAALELRHPRRQVFAVERGDRIAAPRAFAGRRCHPALQRGGVRPVNRRLRLYRAQPHRKAQAVLLEALDLVRLDRGEAREIGLIRVGRIGRPPARVRLGQHALLVRQGGRGKGRNHAAVRDHLPDARLQISPARQRKHRLGPRRGHDALRQKAVHLLHGRCDLPLAPRRRRFGLRLHRVPPVQRLVHQRRAPVRVDVRRRPRVVQERDSRARIGAHQPGHVRLLHVLPKPPSQPPGRLGVQDAGFDARRDRRLSGLEQLRPLDRVTGRRRVVRRLAQLILKAGQRGLRATLERIPPDVELARDGHLVGHGREDVPRSPRQIAGNAVPQLAGTTPELFARGPAVLQVARRLIRLDLAQAAHELHAALRNLRLHLQILLSPRELRQRRARL